jgi:oligoribonuclease (3'-5' exoribonuclease)
MTLRARILLATVALTVLAAAAMAVIGNLMQAQAEARFTEATIHGKTVLWQKIVASQLDHMEVELKILRPFARTRPRASTA